VRDGILSGLLRATAAPRSVMRAIRDLQRRADRNAMLLGELHAARIAAIGEAKSLAEIEFCVYSQWGEDGILDYLVSRMSVPNAAFVEFGVQDYTEANTRFLLKRRNWTGLVIDSSAANVRRIRRDPISEMFDLRSVAATVTTENINALIANSGLRGDIGLLSIDIDGNDYWVWKAIDVVSPRIVVCEYNSVFGNHHPITVPYAPGFERTAAHYSKLFFGASLPALRALADEKGYEFLGCNTSGVNAFFVRSDCAGAFASLAESACYVPSKFRESRDRSGSNTFLAGDLRAAEIADCVVYDVSTARTVRIRDLAPVAGSK
jgi:hypothetical protein